MHFDFTDLHQCSVCSSYAAYGERMTRCLQKVPIICLKALSNHQKIKFSISLMFAPTLLGANLADTRWRPFRNELERQFLEMLQFNINVPSSVYAKYYFDLRTLAEANDLSFPPEPLSKERAQKLEAMSLRYEDKVGRHTPSC